MAADDSVTPERAQRWLDARRRGIGGSDMADLFNIEGPYGGCRRRLWYDKTNTPPDVPKAQTDQMLRGKMLEDAAAQQYTLDTGRKLIRARPGLVHPKYQWARVNADRMIAPVPEHEGKGALEIKTQNAWMFRRTKLDGLPDGYVLQLQHALLVTGATWGAFMVLHPDSWGRARWDVLADAELQEAIIRRGEEFWPTVKDGPVPEKLTMPDVRCFRCPWRRSCQGEDVMMAAAGLSESEAREPLATDERFAEMIVDLQDAKDALAEDESLVERIKAAIKKTLGDREAVSCSEGRIYHRPQATTRLDTKALKAAEPEVYERYSVTATSRPLRVYAIKGRGGDDR